MMRSSSSRHSDLRVLLPIAVALFLLSSIIRFALADYPKGIGVLPDEIRYLNLASSLFSNGELIQRGGYSSFQKILYPLSIMPAFIFDDPQSRVRAITALNCLYVSSAVFPALVLARRIFSNRAPVICCIALTLVLPDMCYSMTFLSESIYLPVALWLIAACLVALEKSGGARYLWCASAGLLCYLSYLCKEVSLGFALAFALMLAIEQASKRRGNRESVKSLACFLLAFALPFVIMKLTLFSGLLNSYNQADPRVLANPYTVLFALYAFVTNLTHFAIAFAFFPLVLPAFTWSRLTRRERELYLFCVLSFAFIFLAVLYTISIREDAGHVGIRPHVRYVAPIFLPLLFLFVKQVLRGDGITIMRDPRVFAVSLGSVIAMALLVVFLLGSGDYSQGFDNAQFHSLRLLGENLPSLPIDPSADPSSSLTEDDIYHGEYLSINVGVWLAKLFVCLYLVFGFWSLLCRNRVGFGIVLVIVIGVLMMANSVGAYLYNKSVYEVEQDEVESVCLIDGLADSIPDGEQMLIVYDDDTSGPNNLLDVYIDNDRLNCCYINKEDFDAAVKEGDGSQRTLLIEADATMGDNIFAANGRTCDENAAVDYVVVNSTQGLRLSPDCAQDATPEGVSGFTVYKIEPGANISLGASALIKARR